MNEQAEQDALFDQLNNVLRLTATRSDHQPARPPANRDMPSAIELIKEAAQTIEAAEKRATEMGERMRELLNDANRELNAAATRIQHAEQRTREAEARTNVAERRAQEADEWLQRLGGSIEESFAGAAALGKRGADSGHKH